MISRQYMRSAFTLIELLISITILSIIMIFLYKSYASLNSSNDIFKKEVNTLESLKLKKKILFLDFAISKKGSVSIQNLDSDNDVVLMQTANSVHRRFNPYIAYIISNEKLYRIESLTKLTYPLDVSSEFDVDVFGDIKRFKVFENKDKKDYLVDVKFNNSQDILLKARALNEK